MDTKIFQQDGDRRIPRHHAARPSSLIVKASNFEPCVTFKCLDLQGHRIASLNYPLKIDTSGCLCFKILTLKINVRTEDGKNNKKALSASD